MPKVRLLNVCSSRSDAALFSLFLIRFCMQSHILVPAPRPALNTSTGLRAPLIQPKHPYRSESGFVITSVVKRTLYHIEQIHTEGCSLQVNVSAVEALYGNPLQSTRSGPLYGAFSYPTKISPETIALFIATHTKPGDTVFDGFAGSGTTGLAALLCEDPPERLRQDAARLNLNVKWGARNAVSVRTWRAWFACCKNTY